MWTPSTARRTPATAADSRWCVNRKARSSSSFRTTAGFHCGDRVARKTAALWRMAPTTGPSGSRHARSSPAGEPMRRDRLATNPALSTRRLKLGTFQTNLDSGCVMSDLDGRIDISWPNTVTLAKLAEEMEFEALVPVARWQGFGGATNPQGPGFEAYTWAAGIAASTSKPGVFATSHISLNHPIIAAKQSTVIDHISSGRYTLNIVTGWNQPEIDMFGTVMMNHEDRYACAEEWLTIIKRLWTEDEAFDHEGKFYKITKGYLQPKPIQSPYPAVMNAGASERGRHFATKYA